MTASRSRTQKNNGASQEALNLQVYRIDGDLVELL
jgi:hypothetical protein